MAIDRSMGRGALISVLFHAAIFAAIFFGLPDWIAPEDLQQPVAVQLATMADITTPPKQELPTPTPTPVEKPKPPEPEPTPPPPQPQAETPPPEPPAPTPPEPEPQPTPPPPEPVPDESVPKPAPAEAQQAEPEPPKIVPAVKPKPPQDKPVEKPKPQEDALASLLKNVEQMKEPDQTQTPPQPNQQPTQPLTQQNLSDAPMTMSEIDAIRQQLAKCWNVPAGARDAQNLAVEIRVMFNPDGSVARAEIVDTSRMASDAFYRTAAESAYRAVLLCSPLQQMPVKKYNTWKNVTLNFDPKEMVGQ